MTSRPKNVPGHEKGMKRTGWPRAVSRPEFPQTRTCAINAFGSSSYPFTTSRHTHEGGVRESAGQNRQGVADERAVQERASDPSRP